MRRLFALACAFALAATLAPAASAYAPFRDKECRFQTLQDGKWTRHEVHLTIHCAIDHWPVSHSTADYVADRESDFRWNAYNASSGASGVYQHLSRYWPGRVASFNRALPRWDLKPDVFNARSNVLVAIRIARMGGWSPWTVV